MEETCSYCNGSGRNDDYQCWQCDGRGYVIVRKPESAEDNPVSDAGPA